MMLRLVPLVLILLLPACGDKSARFLIAPVATAEKVSVRVSSIEVLDVSLPTYAAASEILVQSADGSLKPEKNAIWADDPVRGVTQAIARDLDTRTTATAAVEPWPLDASPDVQLSIRVERMVARADGLFELTGQYAVAARASDITEFVERFSITTPLGGTGPGSVANATGTALSTLGGQIAARLKR